MTPMSIVRIEPATYLDGLALNHPEVPTSGVGCGAVEVAALKVPFLSTLPPPLAVVVVSAVPVAVADADGGGGGGQL